MNFQKLTALGVILFLTGCGGGGGGGGSNGAPAQDETPPAPEPPQITSITVLNTYKINDESERTFYGASRINGPQSASMFDIDSTVDITSIKWVGSAINLGEDTQATFALRIYDGDSVPNAAPIHERIEVVDMELVRTRRSGTKGYYIFSFADDPVFTLPQGRYWLSVVDPETESIDFGWEVEPGKAGGPEGSGGAYRVSSDSAWQTNGNGVSAVESRGHNIQILGATE